MPATLIVLAVLQLFPDAPRLELHEPPARSLLAPAASPLGRGRLLFDHEHRDEAPRGLMAGDIVRPIGELLAGFGVQLVIGSGLWAGEVVVLFSAAVFSAVLSGSTAGLELVTEAGAGTMIFLNGTILPLLSALPVWLIAVSDPSLVPSFLWTWVSGLVTYAAYWAWQARGPPRYAGLDLILWPTHVGSWFLVALVQTVVANLTGRLGQHVHARAPTGALLNVDGPRVSWGAPVPVLAADRSRPGRMLPMVSLAQGRF